MSEEGRGPRVPRSKGSKVQGSQGPRYPKLTFKYELDSKEGPSCLYSKVDMLVFNLAMLSNSKHKPTPWVTIFFYSIMPPYWNLCEQRQDNWQDKENRIEFGENLRKIG